MNGTVTFLFTDLEGSTQLWERHPAAMRTALARHDDLLRQAIEASGGRVVKTTGDGCHAVFANAHDGAAAARAAQLALVAQAWDDLGTDALRVRMGLHTGEVEMRAGDYFGGAVNRAARLMAVAHGGQVLLSAVTAGLAAEQLPAGASLRDLGEHRLKDLTQPEHIFQLVGPGLPADFPPLRTATTLLNNLPVQLTSFIGREREQAEVQQLMVGARLLSLTGPGGTGKTRLSLQVAGEALTHFADGAWLVELAPLADPAQVPAAVAAVWSLREQPGHSLTEALTDYLRAKQLLLILDNCEHLIEACAGLALALLRACPRLSLLASSREALGVPGETAYRVPSLAMPDLECASPQSLLRFDAARLFVERAQAAQTGFAPSARNLSAIIQVCQRLDGIPLAIELAAARIRLLSVEQIAARLDDRFRLLTGGSRTALPRQQTLRALIDWSYDLLPRPEQAALRQLSVFAGGWTLEAAEAVLRLDFDVLELLAQLVNKSLVSVDQAGAEPRYRLLETIRQYAREKLFEAGEAEPARRRHLDYYLGWTGSIEPRLYGAQMVAALEQLDPEQANLRAAVDWGLANDPPAALQLASRLTMYWARRAAGEGLQLIRAALARTAADAPESLADQQLRARALFGEGNLAIVMGDLPAALRTLEASIALARTSQATETLALALGLGTLSASFLGDMPAMRAWGEECLALFQEHPQVQARGLFASLRLIMALAANEPLPPGVPEAALRVARAFGNPFGIATTIQNMARAHYLSGDLEEVVRENVEVGHIGEQLRDRIVLNSSRAEIAHARRRQGRFAEALELYRQSLPAWLELGNGAAAAHDLECLGFIAQAGGQPQRAARLLGAAEAARERLVSPMAGFERPDYEQHLAALQARLSPPEFEAAWAAGRAMSFDEAVALALNEA